MNWGYKILIVILLFVSAMTGMVLVAARQTNEMVDQHYYQKELKYQEVIDGQKNLLTVSATPLLSQRADSVFLTLPKGTFEHFEDGRMEWLKPDNASMDVKLDFQPLNGNEIVLSRSQFGSGMYMVRIRWRNLGTEYYKQESIHLQAQG